MRFAKYSRTLMWLTLPALLAVSAAAQNNPNVLPSQIKDQIARSQAQQSQQASPKPAPAGPPAKAPATPSGKSNTPAKAAAKASDKTVANKNAKPPVERPAGDKAPAVHRDPFESLLTKPGAGGNAEMENLPPGKAGLVVDTLHITGIVRGAQGMIAVVSNPQQRVYFLREGDKLYNGSVEHITLETISFQEQGKDAFGKPIEREVTKRLYPSPGEMQ